MMLRYSFDLEAQALRIERAVRDVLRQGYRTADIFEPGAVQTLPINEIPVNKPTCRWRIH